MAGVLDQHVEADPLQHRRVVGESTTPGRCSGQGTGAEYVAGPLADRA